MYWRKIEPSNTLASLVKTVSIRLGLWRRGVSDRNVGILVKEESRAWYEASRKAAEVLISGDDGDAEWHYRITDDNRYQPDE